MRQPLTTRQSEIFQYLQDYFIENDQLPSILAISMKFSFGQNAAVCHMKSIANKGWVEKNDVNKYRFVKSRWGGQHKGIK